jgi:hypothetical protein
VHNKHEKENDDRVEQEESGPVFDISTEYAYACLPIKSCAAFRCPISDLPAPERCAIWNEKAFYSLGLSLFDR